MLLQGEGDAAEAAGDTTRQLFFGFWEDQDSVFLFPLKYSGCKSTKGHKSMIYSLGQHRELLLLCWAVCACRDLQPHEKASLVSGEQTVSKGAASALLCREQQEQREFVLERDLSFLKTLGKKYLFEH